MTSAFGYAVQLLSRRDYSAYELTNRLAQKGYLSTEIEAAIAQCQQLNLQSDDRFVEALCHTRIQQGYGPLKIAQELQAKQVDRELIASRLEQEQENWFGYALAVRRKKFKYQGKISLVELKKQQRFLLYRGFPAAIIAKIYIDNYDIERL